MDTSDKNIKKVFSTYTKSFDVDLEESIMDRIKLEKSYSAELIQSRKRIKTGMILSALFLIVYFALTYFDTLPQIDERMEMKNNYLPSIFTGFLVVIMYLLSTYSFAYSKEKIEDSGFSK